MHTTSKLYEPAYEAKCPRQHSQDMVEGRPLLPLGVGNERDFHSHWCGCCGDCDGPGWAACCLSTWLPCIAMGWNMKRATGSMRLGLLVGLLVLGMIVFRYILLVWVLSCVPSVTCGYEQNGYECKKIGCSKTAFGSFIVDNIYVIYRVVAIAITLIGVCCRHHIRKVLQMDSLNDKALVRCGGDLLSWVFGPCGLCQEKRTLMINRVEDGVWRGPANMAVPGVAAPQTVPMTVELGSAVVAKRSSPVSEG